MYDLTRSFTYVSVRDDWTQKMYAHVSKGNILPPITPDPVFGFNMNFNKIPSKQEILEKFGLNEKHILFGLFNNRKASLNWLREFSVLSEARGLECVALAFPEGVRFAHPFKKK